MMISCVTFEYSKNPGLPVLFFPKLAAPRQEFPWRSESVFSRKPDLPAAIFARKISRALLTACCRSAQKRNWRRRCGF